MTALMQSQIFFFISSIGFIVTGILVVAILAYILRILSIFSNVLKKAEEDIGFLGETSKDMLVDIRNSTIFKFLFKGSRKKILNIDKPRLPRHA